MNRHPSQRQPAAASRAIALASMTRVPAILGRPQTQRLPGEGSA